ncbi:MAG: uracil-DNA glycosylase [Verrucomicrobia bacterium]|nr:uracil-DNA glycosylase [Verrucomicrobiota bacterium]
MTDKQSLFPTLPQLNACVKACTRCPRLVKFRENVPEKKQFADQTYWKKPVPGFGDKDAYLLILGLAPSAQGGNRTGRIFTGDESARFLFKALHKEGFANQPTSEHLHDGLELHDCYLTASVKCVPPDNKPTAAEQKHCFPYLVNEFFLLKKISAVLVLGGFAFEAYLQYVKAHGGPKIPHRFRHGEKHAIQGFPDLYTCYHPSPQNTNTGKLNQHMLCSVLKQIKKDRPSS